MPRRNIGFPKIAGDDQLAVTRVQDLHRNRSRASLLYYRELPPRTQPDGRLLEARNPSRLATFTRTLAVMPGFHSGAFFSRYENGTPKHAQIRAEPEGGGHFGQIFQHCRERLARSRVENDLGWETGLKIRVVFIVDDRNDTDLPHVGYGDERPPFEDCVPLLYFTIRLEVVSAEDHARLGSPDGHFLDLAQQAAQLEIGLLEGQANEIQFRFRGLFESVQSLLGFPHSIFAFEFSS